MCGIYLTNKNISVDEATEKLKLINYRGPDNLSVQKIDNLILGHLRLSILDLDKRSNQPFFGFENYIVFNGEIYNYQEIKKELISLNYSFKTTSDTEVLLAAYKEWGKFFVERLNGMFSFCIYDVKKNVIFCARDRLGVKPFYYTFEDGIFEICSQVISLKNNHEISSKAISLYLSCGYVPSPYSIYVGINKLKPGHTLEINLNSNSLNAECYWDLKLQSTSKLSYNEAKEQLHDLLVDAVKIRLQSDVKVGSFLSGGIDSALVSAIANKLTATQVNTYTIGFDDEEYDESKAAKTFAQILNTNHHEIQCTSEDVKRMLPVFFSVYDEPFSDSSALPTLLLNSKTKEHVTVALSGDGGDESFLGYNHFQSVQKFTKVLQIPRIIRTGIHLIFRRLKLKGKYKNVASIFSIKTVEDFISAIFISKYDSLLIHQYDELFADYEQYKWLSNHPIQKTADYNIKLWLENDSNVKVDRGSMAFSVEVRSPFLDYRIIEFARTLPIHFRLNKEKRKIILKDILKEYIDESMFNLPKKGFAIPMSYWIRNDLRSNFLNELKEEKLKRIPNLNVSKFLIKLQNHLNEIEDNSIDIWRVYVLIKWMQVNDMGIKNDFNVIN